jgi:hypothetical protein
MVLKGYSHFGVTTIRIAVRFILIDYRLSKVEGKWRHDNQRSGNQDNDIQSYSIQQSGIKANKIERNEIKHNDNQH